MADMQRAFNSKRSIAEIALTRMCDPKLVTSSESLLLRIEELERELTMIKLGVVHTVGSQSSAPAPEVVVENSRELPADKPEATTATPQLYAGWGDVISRIGEIKRSLSAGISGAAVYRTGSVSFTIRLNDFFAKKLSSSETDLSIVRGVIAEREHKSPNEIELKIVCATESRNSPFSEIENALN